MAEYLKSENSSYNIEVIDTPIYYFKDEKKPRATTEDNAIALVKKNPTIIEDEKTVIVSGQPHAVSQKNQMISAILKYNQKEKTLELCDNKLFKMLNFVAKQENTTINNLATHLSTFAGTVFSSYQKLYSKYNEKELSNYSMDDIKQIEQHKTSLKLTEAFNAISEIVDSKLIQHK